MTSVLIILTTKYKTWEKTHNYFGQKSITVTGKSERGNVTFIHISIFIFVLLTHVHIVDTCTRRKPQIQHFATDCALKSDVEVI